MGYYKNMSRRCLLLNAIIKHPGKKKLEILTRTKFSRIPPSLPYNCIYRFDARGQVPARVRVARDDGLDLHLLAAGRVDGALLRART